MNNIITDIKALQEETLLNLKSSKANNTVGAYKADFNDFGIFEYQLEYQGTSCVCLQTWAVSS